MKKVFSVLCSIFFIPSFFGFIYAESYVPTTNDVATLKAIESKLSSIPSNKKKELYPLIRTTYAQATEGTRKSYIFDKLYVLVGSDVEEDIDTLERWLGFFPQITQNAIKGNDRIEEARFYVSLRQRIVDRIDEVYDPEGDGLVYYKTTVAHLYLYESLLTTIEEDHAGARIASQKGLDILSDIEASEIVAKETKDYFLSLEPLLRDALIYAKRNDCKYRDEKYPEEDLIHEDDDFYCMYIEDGDVYRGMGYDIVREMLRDYSQLKVSSLMVLQAYEAWYERDIYNSELGTYYCKGEHPDKDCFWLTIDEGVTNITRY